MDIDELRKLLREGCSGRALTSLLTERNDALLKDIFASIESSSGLCLIAVGGYGRAELAPFSDIDIMLFARDRSPSEKAAGFLYKLWNTNLCVGHSFRTPADCIAEARKDIRTRTSLLEHRFIAGDKDLYRYFMDNVYPEIAFREPKKFITEKLREVEERHRKISDSVFMLEPHIKEGRGSLRDIHTLVWLSGVRLRTRSFDDLAKVLNAEDFRKLDKAFDFMLKVRFCLHLLSGRRNDILSFEFHDRAAELLNFKASRNFLASERFMRYFYLKAAIIDDIVSRAFEIFGTPYREPETGRESRVAHFFYAKRKITDTFSLSKNRIVAAEGVFGGDPVKIIEAFAVMATTGKRLSPRLREEIRKNLFRIGRPARKSKRAVEAFFGILRSDRVFVTLREMHRCGVLGRFIPEFGALSFLVVYEPYHRYTVDEHTLHAIGRLEGLRNTKYGNLSHLSSVFKGVGSPEALFLALLLHDIGKRGILKSYRYGSGGGHHDEVGYRELKNILERFNLPLEIRSRVEFLVKNHLLMWASALRSETEDMEVIARFADEVGGRENLDALYLLTYADMASVSDDFWTEWKAYLLRELYETTARYIAGATMGLAGVPAGIPYALPLSSSERAAMSDFISRMPERYVISTTPEQILDDYRLSRAVEEKGFAFRVRPDVGGTAEVTVGAWDRPGLFSGIVGVLSSMRMNIYRARAYTGKGGIVIDKMYISNWMELEWDGLTENLGDRLATAVMAGDSRAYEETLGRAKDSRPYHREAPEAYGRFGSFIELDNESSSGNSIVEFFARDRLGLLYDVTSLIHEMDIDIISARINTESGIAHDIFSVQKKGKKLEGIAIQELLLSLWERLT